MIGRKKTHQTVPVPQPQDLASAARALGRDPEALAAFEAAWERRRLEEPETDQGLITSHLPFLARKRHDAAVATPEQEQTAREMAHAIALRLAGDEDVPEVTPEDVSGLPREVAPQLTHDAMRYDSPPGAADAAVLMALAQAADAQDPNARRQWLARARQGLDMLDIDPLVYEMLSADPTSMGNWLGPLMAAADATDGVEVPRTRVVRVPAPILQLPRTLEPDELTQATRNVVNEWATVAFDLRPDGDYFVRTGTFSSKYDFRNARVRGGEVAELGEYLLYLSHQAAEMAGPLTMPHPMIGVSTTNEWVVRDYVTSASDLATIYHGLPLRVEFRCFVDLDEREVLGVVPYWDPEAMTESLGSRAAQGDAEAAHDLVSFMAWWETAADDFERLCPKAARVCEDLMANGLAELGGQWSLDLMLTTDDNGAETLWAIDMAPAHRSALRDRIGDPSRILDAGEPDWAAALPG